MTLSLLICAVLAAPGDTELLHFSAPWCQACRQSEPAVRRLESDGISVRHINVDEHPDVARKYNVQTVPSFVLVSRGRELRRIDRAVSYDELVELVRSKTTVRGQDPATDSRRTRQFEEPRNPAPKANELSGSRTSAEERALRSTVRLRIEDRSGQSYGTGTIVDIHGDECLVLTCGHIFRDSDGRGRIVIDVFAAESSQPVAGKLLRFDLENDLALVICRPAVQLDAARVSGKPRRTSPGSNVFTVGCNQGGEPSVMRGRVNAINKYVGPPANIVVSGQPQDGRSGGGLFSSDGELIGICQAADPEYNEGLYAHLPAIHDYLDKANLTFVYQHTDSAAGLADTKVPTRRDSGQGRALPRLEEAGKSGLSFDNTLVSATDLISHDATEVVCIVRSKTDSTAKSQVMVLDRPSREFLSQLRQEQSRQDHRQVTNLRVPQRRSVREANTKFLPRLP